MIGYILAGLAPALSLLRQLFSVGRATLFTLAAAAGAIVLQRKLAAESERRESNRFAEKLAANHAVAELAATAETDQEADHALDSAAHADRS